MTKKKIVYLILGGVSIFFITLSALYLFVPDHYIDVIDLKKEEKTINKLGDQEVVNIKNRLTNDQLSDLPAKELFSKYTKEAQDDLKNIFGEYQNSLDYATTLIGKVIPATSLKTTSGKMVSINNKTVIVILNRGDKSKNFIPILNKTEKEEGVTYLLLFPSEKTEDTKKFLIENNLNTEVWAVATLEDNPRTNTQPDLLGIAEYYFNAQGVPSYLSIDTNSITFAGGVGEENQYQQFLENAFKKPYFYNKIEEKEEKDSGDK